MKKVNRFTMLIRHDDDSLLHRHPNKSVFRSQIERYFGPVPQGPYQVTFTKTRRGGYRQIDLTGSSVLCIWPKSWRPLTRFTRRVREL
jgi:hypothetical protein